MLPNSLAAHPCFKTLDPESCRILDRHCAWVKTAAGAWVVGQTANDRDVYFVMSGRLRAVLHGVRQDLIFNDMEAGSFFGELAALDGGARSLSVFAVNDSMVAKMPCAVFVETVFTHRPLGEAVVATLVARNRSMTRRVGELGALDVRSRVHAELLRLARPDRENPKARDHPRAAKSVGARIAYQHAAGNCVARDQRHGARRPDRAPAGRHCHHRRAGA